MNPSPHKPPKTLADYVVIGISPVLIMCLVGSLAFFLARVFCRTDAIASVRWVLFWFVLAIVLVSRIAIEKSKSHALAYGGALALATCLFLAWMVPAMIVPATLVLAITWWCAHKLTFDCTLIDDTEDASGRGVLDAALPKSARDATSRTLSPDRHDAFALGDGPVRGATAGHRPAVREQSLRNILNEPPKTPRAPGRWVVYFSLAALPLFGIGQLLLPNDEPGPRRAGFFLLLIYLAAALGLLVTTSFLGLRRYLRQRYLTMPANVAVGWIRFGVVVIVVMLALAILLPRPGADYTWNTLTYQINHQVHRATDYAFEWNTPGEGDGWPGTELGNGSAQPHQPKPKPQTRPSQSQPSSSSQPNAVGPHSESGPGNNNGGQTSATSTPSQSETAQQQQTDSDRQGHAGQSTGSGQQSGGREQNGAGMPKATPQTGGAGGDDGADENRRYADQPDQTGAGGGGKGGNSGSGGGQKQVNRSNPPQAQKASVTPQNTTEPTTEPKRPPSPKPRTLNLELLFKILLFVLVTALVVWFAIRNRALIAQLFREFVALLKRFFSALAGFRWQRRKTTPNRARDAVEELPAYSQFSDPFLMGKDSIWPRERLISYTYEALQAWSRDRHCGPRSQETPREFCLRLRRQFPDVTSELNHLLLLYTYAAFAETLPEDPDLEPLQRLWGFLSTTGEAVSSTPAHAGTV